MQETPPRHHPWMPLVLLALLVPLIFTFFYVQVIATSFSLFGLTAQQAFWLLIVSLVGGMINIPLTRRRVQLADPHMANMTPTMQMLATVFHFYPPATVEEVVAVNVGGALIPVGFSAYLLARDPGVIALAVGATVIVAIVAKLLARPMPGLGIALPGFIAPITAAIVAFGLVKLTGGGPGMVGVATVAYVSGALGTLIGADLLNLPLVLRGGLLAAGPQRLLRPGPIVPVNPDKPRVLSIGGAGVFDGVFLTGVLAVFLVGLTSVRF
jgi:uncharacterized membrane protein